ncbi:hypothetical protein COTS27_01183 [Spirochaetota bacterium]|nr:hypothetical protein COTS27_01183 [Spirochaetota bacterium]
MALKFLSNVKARIYVFASLLLLILILLLMNNLYSFNEYNTKNINKYVISGYDTVAYFTQGTPTKGSKEHSYVWKDATWLFSSSEHLELFKADPEKYAPQYGGYCAWAVAAKGKLFNIDPEIWKIVDGKLYLNYNKKVGEKWEADIPGFISQADEKWPEILSKKKKP